MKQSTCKLEFGSEKDNLVKKLKLIPGIVFVDFNECWRNYHDTVVFYLTRPLSYENIEVLIHLRPDECDTMNLKHYAMKFIKGSKTLWRLWWD
jgi:hypothetical protein